MKQVVLVDIGRCSFHEDAIKMLTSVADVLFETLNLESIAKQKDAIAVIVGGDVKVNSEFLQLAPKLKIVARYGVGYDNVDLEACARKGIYVTITADALSNAVADLTFSLILCLSRRILKADEFVRRKWMRPKRESFAMGLDLEGKIIGIVGMGRIGFEVARRARCFRMKILYHDLVRRAKAESQFGANRVPLDELLHKSNYITIHVPLNDKTMGLIGRRELSLMKETAFLINTSRGPVVDQKALIEFLKKRRIAGAGLDVFDREPPSLDDPILQLDNVVLTPHIGSATFETRRRMSISCAEQVIKVLKGEHPSNTIVKAR